MFQEEIEGTIRHGYNFSLCRAAALANYLNGSLKVKSKSSQGGTLQLKIAVDQQEDYPDSGFKVKDKRTALEYLTINGHRVYDSVVPENYARFMKEGFEPVNGSAPSEN